ncbi:MAG: hypothetical protein HYR88_11295 [Verrucomicrobia bacterium]|nr:hypothetical protein [Verrucomicrobiota bacterium]MBI3868064.1 hypothetical protein [Verrucomicrobiota bacterium]
MGSTTSTPGIASVLPLIHPLDDFYKHAGLPLPFVEAVTPERMPEPDRSLLVHANDMTSTLIAFHKRSIHLEVLRRETRGAYYLRAVALLLDEVDTAVEFGAIKIELTALPSAARRAILEERLPLGQVLKDFSVAFVSRPKAFLRITSDSFINGALRLKAPSVLYGRRNTLSIEDRGAFAEIVEILPSADPGARGARSSQHA